MQINFDRPNLRDQAAIFKPEFLNEFIPVLEYQATSLTAEEYETYSLALRFVGHVQDAIRRKEPQIYIGRRIRSFPPLVPKVLIQYLQQKEPRALVIIAHLMSLAKIVEDSWWFRDEAERHVYGVQSLLPPEWQWAMEWPLRTLHDLAELRKSDAHWQVHDRTSEAQDAGREPVFGGVMSTR